MKAIPQGRDGPGNAGQGDEPFLLAVITLPVFFPGEVEILEGLMAAGLEKLHLRKPGAREEEMDGLLKQIAPRWRSRLVLHGGGEVWGLASQYGVPQVHSALREAGNGPLREAGNGGLARHKGNSSGGQPAISASLHSWGEMKEVENSDLAYVFMSPVFDSISKPGYRANPLLLRRPVGPYPCKTIGLGGVDKVTIGELVRGGWDGGAVLGWIWEEPGAALERYHQLKNSIRWNYRSDNDNYR